MKKIFSVILIVASIVIFSKNIPGTKAAERGAKITFTGDIMMHISVKAAAYAQSKTSVGNKGFNHLFKRIKPRLENSDIVMGNMEFPVSPPYKSEGIVFNCIPEVIPAIKKAGFTLLTLANNHVLDQWGRGVVSTMNFLKKYRVDFFGVRESEKSARAGRVIEVGGIKVGFIGYTGLFNYWRPINTKQYSVNHFYKKKKIIEDIRRIKKRCDFLVMTVHVGKEYTIIPEEKDVQLLRQYLELGVDLVIGHHPHVLQYAEKYMTRDSRKCFIFYSLGNFISGQQRVYDMPDGRGKFSTQESAIIHLYLNREGDAISQRFEVLPIWTINGSIKQGKRWVKNIQTVALMERIAELNDELKKANPKRKNQIKTRLRTLRARAEVVKRIIFYKQRIDEIDML